MSNLFVQPVKPRKLGAYYALLTATLLLNATVPMATYLSLPGVARVIVSCGMVFVPVFFAGVILATSFRDSIRPDVDFGSNIGGVILGGLSENLSLMLGFNNLILPAIAYYVMSAAFGSRRVN